MSTSPLARGRSFLLAAALVAMSLLASTPIADGATGFSFHR
jgi:hypothetical protein